MTDSSDAGAPAVAGDARFPCHSCGAILRFTPGTEHLACGHCGATTEVPTSPEAIEELDFDAHVAELEERADTVEVLTIRCETCGAETTLDAGTTAGRCAYCGVDVVSATRSRRLLRPSSLLPFRITREQAREAFAKWVARLWFAPNALARQARIDERLAGIYVPYWTFDSATTSWYTGMRGEHYWVSESYTTTENGRSVTRTRQVRKTRWWPTSGVVFRAFDDVLVLAGSSLPRDYAEALEPWDLSALTPYQDDYLAGFRAESYTIGLADGFELAAQRMDGPIRDSIRRDIGGDEQRILTVRTRHDDVSFKHVLLPIWLSSYRFRGKAYRFLVNGRTGETRGERPWSWVKITLAVLAGLAVVAAIVFLTR